MTAWTLRANNSRFSPVPLPKRFGGLRPLVVSKMSKPAWILIYILCTQLGSVAMAPAAAQNLVPGDRLRIQTHAEPCRWVKGELVAVEDGNLAIRPDGTGTTMLDLDIMRLSRIQISQGQRRHAGRGALIGGLTGFVFLGIGLTVGESDPDPYGALPSKGEILLVGTLGGAAIGALVGLAIRTENWEEVPVPLVTISPRTGEVVLGLALAW